MSEQPSTHHITTGATKGSSKFDPFDFTFLSSAPEETISLLARLCSKVGLVPPLLMIPAELRLRIYEFAFEAHWEQGEMRICQGEYLMQHNQVKGIQGMEIKDDFKPRILEPPLLRTCKLFREEGNAEYKLFLQAICNSLSREAQAWAHSQCSTRTKLGLFLHLLYFNGKYEISIKAALGNGAAHKAENAETELERLYRIEIREMIKVLNLVTSQEQSKAFAWTHIPRHTY
ncbi:hypothetical protein BST61_g4080 [Cercospora zeina]